MEMLEKKTKPVKAPNTNKFVLVKPITHTTIYQLIAKRKPNTHKPLIAR